MNLANKITCVRLLLIPVYVAVVLYTEWQLLALIIFAIASFTDFLDGYVARKYNMVTDLGKFMDPLVDKILTISAFILFTSTGQISTIATIIVVARELMISVFRALAASKNIVIAANIWGKIKTILQITTVLAIHVYQINGWHEDYVRYILVGIMSIVTVYSGFKYIMDNRKVLL